MFSRDVYAIGGNKSAAALSGIDVKKVTFWCYVNTGFLAGGAGVVYSARMNRAQPSAGNMFELDAIAACFIGGASTTGGIGRLSGALIGGLIMAVMSNGMQLMGASTSTQQIVKGAVLLLAVAVDVWNKQRASAGGIAKLLMRAGSGHAVAPRPHVCPWGLSVWSVVFVRSNERDVSLAWGKVPVTEKRAGEDAFQSRKIATMRQA